MRDEAVHAVEVLVQRLEGLDVEGDGQVTTSAPLVRVVRSHDGGAEFAAGEHARQHVHHQRDAVALVPRHGQQDARDRFERIGCALPVGGHRPVVGDGHAGLPCVVDLAAGDRGVGDVEHHRRLIAQRRADRPRVRADGFLSSTPRGHRRTGIGRQEADATAFGGQARVVHGGAEVIRVADAHHADAVLLRALDRAIDGHRRQHLPDPVAAIDHRHRARIDGNAWRGHRAHRSGPDPRGVPGQPQHAMRRVAPQLRLDQRVGDEGGVGRRDAVPEQDLRAEGG